MHWEENVSNYEDICKFPAGGDFTAKWSSVVYDDGMELEEVASA